MEKLCSDTSRLKPFHNNLTLRDLSTVQSYLKTLCNRQEITLEGKTAMTPKFAQVGGAHGLPKIHKNYNHLPTFHPIIDKTYTVNYDIAKFLSSLLNALTENEFTITDSFKAASRIQTISSSLFDEDYKFISCDFWSLFTNFSLNNIIKIVLNCMYEDKVIHTTLFIRKRKMKKLNIDSCATAAFSLSNKIYK